MKDTIWQRLVAQTGPFAGAGLFALLLSSVTVWFSSGAVAAWICVVAFTILLCAIAVFPLRVLVLMVPAIVAIAGLGLCLFSGGLNGGAISACLWPLLGAGWWAQSRPDSKQLFTAFGSSCAALLGVTILDGGVATTELSAPFGAAGVLALGVGGALAVSSFITWSKVASASLQSYQSTADFVGLVSERDQAVRDAQIARAQTKDRAQFMAEMSHEIRTPLNAILGFADTMRENVFGPIPAAYSDYPELIHKSGNHLLDLVSDLLDLSKVDAGKYELAIKAQKLDEIVSEGIRLSSGSARANGVQIRHEASGPVLVDADARALRQIIFNLLSNAIKFTPRDGRIIVRVKQDGASKFGLLEVEDNGQGMNETDLARVTEPWSQARDVATGQKPDTTQVRGSGLGLALVKRFAQLQGGDLELASSLGVGTLARITLPLSNKATLPT
jgi:signal transduction histidine kinase